VSHISPTPLSDDEFDTLAELLAEYSSFDTDGMLGLFHAVVVAPGLVLPSAWLPKLAPRGFAGRDSKAVDDFVGLVMRQYNDVGDALEHGRGLLPDRDNVQACASFAAGYVAGAELDPQWIGNDDHWSFVAPFAYLADRPDLVAPDLLAKLEQHLAPDPKNFLRQQLSGLVQAANESFEKYRQAAAPPALSSRPSRVGRNDPCTCGSGKKFKRCCAVRGTSPS
jgi:uncharacterized protein